ncbi:MAG: transposase family protein, partial [Bacteroidota bacterium]
MPTSIPDRPFQIVCSDIFQLNNKYYLIVVDRFSGFLHIFYSRTPPNHKFLEKHLRDVFTRYGRPDELESDGGPQFKSSEFASFLQSWGVSHRLSSPYYPQSNGRAELGVKTAKRLLRDNTGPDGSINNNMVACAVLQYHNTPLQGCPMSPAQLLFGRPLADFLPVNPNAYCLHPHWRQQTMRAQQQRSSHHNNIKQHYNRGTRHLSPLVTGQQVVIQNPFTKRWDQTGTIIGVLPHRKYRITLKSTANTTYRNRRFLKPIATAGSTARNNTTRSAPPAPVCMERTPVLPTTRQDPCNPPKELSPRLHSSLRRLLPYNNPGLMENSS